MESNYWTRVLTQRTMKRRKALALAATGLTGAALLAACGDEDATGGSTSAPAATTAPGSTSAPGAATATTEAAVPSQTGSFTPSDGPPQPGGTLTFPQGTTINFNAVANWTEGTGGLGGSHVYDRPLTAREDERRFILEALESVETPDELTVIMKLIPGMTYHDFPPVNGRPVVAQDIVASQDYIENLPQAFDVIFHKDFLDSAEATDDRTVVYHLQKPNAYLFSQNQLGSGTGQLIMPPETFDELDTARQIGSGPYFSESAQLGVEYVYQKFSGYHEASKGLPYIDTRKALFLPDRAAQEAAFRSGQLTQWRGASPTQIEQVPQDMGDDVFLVKIPGFNGFAFQMNMTRDFPWQTDVRVREAFWRLIDRQQILELAWGGEGIIQDGLLPASLPAYKLDAADAAPFYVEDIAKAKQLLSAANFDIDKEWEFFATASPTWEAAAQVMQQQFLRGGIKTQIDKVAGGAELFQRWTDNDWVFQVSQPPGTDTPSQVLRLQHSECWSDVYHNFALFDPEIDAMIELSETTVDFEQNVKLVKEIQLLAMQKWTSAYLTLTPNNNELFSSKVQNWEKSLARPNYQIAAWLKE